MFFLAKKWNFFLYSNPVTTWNPSRVFWKPFFTNLAIRTSLRVRPMCGKPNSSSSRWYTWNFSDVLLNGTNGQLKTVGWVEVGFSYISEMSVGNWRTFFPVIALFYSESPAEVIFRSGTVSRALLFALFITKVLYFQKNIKVHNITPKYKPSTFLERSRWDLQENGFTFHSSLIYLKIWDKTQKYMHFFMPNTLHRSHIWRYLQTYFPHTLHWSARLHICSWILDKLLIYLTYVL